MINCFAQLNFHPLNFQKSRVNLNTFIDKSTEMNNINIFNLSKIIPLRLKLEKLQGKNDNSLLLQNTNRNFYKITRKVNTPSFKISFNKINNNFHESYDAQKNFVDPCNNNDKAHSNIIQNIDKMQNKNRFEIMNNPSNKEPSFQFHPKRHTINYIKLNILKMKNLSNVHINVNDNSNQQKKEKVIILNANLLKKMNRKHQSFQSETTRFTNFSNELFKTKFQRNKFLH